VAADLSGDLVGVGEPPLVHGEEDALDVKLAVVAVAHAAEELEHLGESLHGIVLALDGDDDAVGRGQGVDGQKAE